MDITEIETENINLIDLETIKPKKNRGRPKKSNKKEEENVDKPEEIVEKTDIDKLKEELMNYAEVNPDILTKTINNNMSKIVENMEIDELRARIRLAKRASCAKLDNSVTENIITIANQVSGNLLNCYEELQESTMKDKLLKESTRDYLSLNVLDYIPSEIKIMGLYGSHLGSSYYSAAAKRPKPEPKVEESVQPMGDLDALKEKLINLKNSIPN